MKIATISSKYQVTIPKAILLSLQLHHGSKVILYPEKDTLMLKPLRSSIAQQTAGSLNKYIDSKKRGIPFSQVRDETQKIVAEELAKTYE